MLVCNRFSGDYQFILKGGQGLGSTPAVTKDHITAYEAVQLNILKRGNDGWESIEDDDFIFSAHPWLLDHIAYNIELLQTEMEVAPMLALHNVPLEAALEISKEGIQWQQL